MPMGEYIPNLHLFCQVLCWCVSPHWHRHLQINLTGWLGPSQPQQSKVTLQSTEWHQCLMEHTTTYLGKEKEAVDHCKVNAAIYGSAACLWNPLGHSFPLSITYREVKTVTTKITLFNIPLYPTPSVVHQRRLFISRGSRVHSCLFCHSSVSQCKALVIIRGHPVWLQSLKEELSVSENMFIAVSVCISGSVCLW